MAYSAAGRLEGDLARGVLYLTCQKCSDQLGFISNLYLARTKFFLSKNLKFELR